MTKRGALSLGVEVTPHWSLAAIVDATGEIVHRLDPYDSLSETLAAASAAADAPFVHAGVAAAEWDSAAASAAVAEITRAFPSTAVLPAPMPSGVALALADASSGVARGARHVVAFALGDHPVGGVLLDGKPWGGAHGLAASVAWMALNPIERDEYRRRGCLEAEAGPGGIVRRLIWRVKAGDHSIVTDRVNGDFSRIGVEDVLAGAREGDGVSVSVVRDTIKYLGMAIANLVTVIDPDIVVLGGLIESDADLVLEPLRQECSRRLHPTLAAQVRIELSALGSYGPAVGAATHAMAAAAA
jgi:predicted NBD/HSP70 family sugar kinase